MSNFFRKNAKTFDILRWGGYNRVVKKRFDIEFFKKEAKDERFKCKKKIVFDYL